MDPSQEAILIPGILEMKGTCNKSGNNEAEKDRKTNGASVAVGIKKKARVKGCTPHCMPNGPNAKGPSPRSPKSSADTVKACLIGPRNSLKSIPAPENKTKWLRLATFRFTYYSHEMEVDGQ
ncbi:hypothetical protein CDAR_14811 [Caerostris darwini]|uniref:Uncharacterized protein n=1 Tax=Caerostris darwini TaxID=1538125 RepID=A0AAV4W8K1_9ARAC|nr:hypothetical protein CDAR_14811 [Caerostris darwini]